jgi:hypothetical protein
MDDSSPIATAAAELGLQPIHQPRWGLALLVTTACLFVACALGAVLSQVLVAPHATQSPSGLASKHQSPDEAALQTSRPQELPRLEEKPGQKKTLVARTSPPPSPMKSEPPNLPEAIPVVKKEAPVVRKKPAPPEPPPSPVVQEPLPENLVSIMCKRRKSSQMEDLSSQLLTVPEIALDTVADTAKNLLQKIKSKGTNDSHDQLMVELVAKRQDLKGLPLLLGKDCRLSKTAATKLEKCAQRVRDTYRATLAKGSGYPYTAFSNFRSEMLEKVGKGGVSFHEPEAIPALQQLLMSEEHRVRGVLVELLGQIKEKPASVALARRATFDLDPEIREAALKELKERPSSQYLQVFLDALRYPWAPAANHAAEALVFLQLREAVPYLVPLLEEPDPAAPFETVVDKKTVVVVPELVRINHLSNCLLCHAPSFAKADPVRGRILGRNEPVPSLLNPVYYQKSSGQFVRGDVTYLRQDFAVMQPVAKPGKWPAEQRFDFLIRVRPLTKDETATLAKQKKKVGPQPLGEQHQAVLFALRELTRQDVGTSAQAWQKLLNAPRTDTGKVSKGDEKKTALK